MKTYQDLLNCGEDESARAAFVLSVIQDHQSSDAYRIASTAEKYYAKQNVTISKFQKLLYDLQGRAHPDMFSANYKLKTTFFRRFVIQQAQYVLSNGVTFQTKNTKKRLGKDFDTKLQKAAKKALVDGVSYLFYNVDHVEVFGFADTPIDPGFAPLLDEEDGGLKAGVRYWQVRSDAPRRATLFELDGFTEYIEKKDKVDVGTWETTLTPIGEKRTYKVKVRSAPLIGEEYLDGENYPGFPIVPMYGNDLHQSEIVGIQESIDCYDFIKSGFANEIDDFSGVYWTLKNSGGMDDMDLARFIERMRIVRAATLDDDQEAEAHTLEIPVEAREKLLDRLRADLYEDFMLLDTEKALSGNMTATAIRLAYQQQDDKCGDFEYCLIEAIDRLLALAGIEDVPTFKWNRIANQTEETQMVMTAAAVLDEESILKHLPWLTPEEVEELLKRKAADELDRFGNDNSDAESGGLISAIKKAIGILAKAIGLKVFSKDNNEEKSEDEAEDDKDNAEV